MGSLNPSIETKSFSAIQNESIKYRSNLKGKILINSHCPSFHKIFYALAQCHLFGNHLAERHIANRHLIMTIDIGTTDIRPTDILETDTYQTDIKLKHLAER